MTNISAKASGFMLVAGLLYPGVVQAQSDPYITPSLTIQALHDDNILFAPGQETDDFIARVSPQIDMGLESERLSLQGIYTFDAEAYKENTDLNDGFIRQSATANASYDFSELLNFSIEGVYVETDTPIALNITTGLSPGRVDSQRASVNPALTYQMSRNTELVGEYRYVNDKIDGGVDSDTHSPRLEVNRQVNDRNTVSFFYTYNRYVFDSGETITSHVPMAGWLHRFNPNTTMTLAAGPRISEDTEDTEDLEAAFTFQRQLAGGEFSINYNRTQTTTIGERGIAETDRVGVNFTYALTPAVNILISPYYTNGVQSGADFEVYQFDLALDYELNDFITFISSYQYSLQEVGFGNPAFGTQGVEDLERNVAMIGFRLTL